jgi:hypothetical protein
MAVKISVGQIDTVGHGEPLPSFCEATEALSELSSSFYNRDTVRVDRWRSVQGFVRSGNRVNNTAWQG